MSSEEIRCLLRLRETEGLGDRGISRLVDELGSASRAWGASDDTLSDLLGRPVRRDPAGASDAARSALARARELDVLVTGLGLPDYPPLLLHLDDPPPVLFLRGRVELLAAPCVAVVGSRRATVYGRRVAERIGASLARAGRVVASGLALGVDAAAHRGALAAGGGAVGILGSGIDVPSPRTNRDLFEELARDHLLVSEFLPGMSPQRFHFPMRNRVMAALSSAVVVVEAAARSGALITVDHALDVGRDVLAVPGPVDRPTSAGTNAMIRDGATIVCDPDRMEDVLAAPPVPAPWLPKPEEDRPPPGTFGRPRDPGDGDPVPPSGLSADQLRVWNALGERDRTVDALVRELGLPAGRVLALLSDLELSGWAVARAGMRYARSAAG